MIYAVLFVSLFYFIYYLGHKKAKSNSRIRGYRLERYQLKDEEHCWSTYGRFLTICGEVYDKKLLKLNSNTTKQSCGNVFYGLKAVATRRRSSELRGT